MTFTQLHPPLTTKPILGYPDFDRHFMVQNNASERGLGVVLTQDFDGEEHPVLYISHKLTPTEQCYAALERHKQTKILPYR